MNRRITKRRSVTFDALGDYEDSNEKLDQAIYNWGLSLKTTGDTASAVELLDALPQDSTTRQLVGDFILSEALRLKQTGDLETAAALFAALGDLGDAQENYNATRYEMAQQQMILGNYRQAAVIFEALGAYEDSAVQLEDALFNAYGQYFDAAEAAYEAEDWQKIVQLLDGYDMTDLPQAYQELQGWYEEACFEAGEALYADGQPFAALPLLSADRKPARSGGQRVHAPRVPHPRQLGK